MANPIIRDIKARGGAGSVTVLGAQVGDLMIALACTNDQGSNGVDASVCSVSPGTWQKHLSNHGGNLTPGAQVSTIGVATAGDQTVQFTAPSDNEYSNYVMLIGSPHETPVDGPLGLNVLDNTSQVAPSISPADIDDLLICLFVGRSGGTYSSIPSGMTESARVTPATVQSLVCTQFLTSSGATGTRTAVYTDSDDYVAVSMAIRGAEATEPTPTGPPAGVWLPYYL